MHRISPHEEIRPCEIFDMIGGTSTGGIIAVMLGRLVRSKLPTYIRQLSALMIDGRVFEVFFEIFWG